MAKIVTTKFPDLTTYRLEQIVPEIKRMIENNERPFHMDLIHAENCLEDFKALGISFTALTLGQALKRAGALRLPRMTLGKSFSCLWALRETTQYNRMSIAWLRTHYEEQSKQKPPALGPRFDPDAPQ